MSCVNLHCSVVIAICGSMISELLKSLKVLVAKDVGVDCGFSVLRLSNSVIVIKAAVRSFKFTSVIYDS
jgi:hypothetical protein